MLNSDISLYSTMQNYHSSDLNERKIICGNNFFHESQLCNDQLLGSFSPLSTIEIPSSLNYLSLPGLQPISDASTSNITASTPTAMYDYSNATVEQLYAQNLSSAQRNSLDNERKRPIIRSDIGPMLSEYATVEGSNKKKKNVVPLLGEEENRRPHSRYFVDNRLSEPTRGKQPQSEEKRLSERMKAKQQLSKDTQVLYRIRAKRSQKIGDRITTLQKLVSPFGKTDTASVLKEASARIKILHNQIQMLTNPYFRPDNFRHYHHKHDLQDDTGEIKNGLQKRGLCLVPVSFTHKIIKEAKP
ncbi:hypothetical protein MKX01_034750 [Papaver californicum]|nr:hypothetical protein MKX01_034750 [Papaver californicum]